MNLREAQSELRRLLSRVEPSQLPKLLDWMRTSDELDEPLVDNNRVILRCIADDIRDSLPTDAMLPCEANALHKMKQRARPTVHVDAFLYDDEHVDSLCEAGRMSRCYCLKCGSRSTAPLGARVRLHSIHCGAPFSHNCCLCVQTDFVSHSFSMCELLFLFQNVLPDLRGRTLVDVGSRLGAVLYAGYVYSSASRLVGVELSEEFVHLQNKIVLKYGMDARVQVIHADVCTQEAVLRNADVVVMNNVFEYFMEPGEQVRTWRFIMQAFRKRGSLLVTVPGLHEALQPLQEPLPAGWVEELPLDYHVHVGKDDADLEDLRQIHLYRVL